MTNQIEVRSYSRPSRLRTKVAGVVPVWVVLLLVAGLVVGFTGSIISKTQSANNSPLAVFIGFKTGTTPTATVNLNTVVAPILQAQAQNGFVGTVHLVFSIGSNSAADTCASLANQLESVPGAADGKIEWKLAASGSMVANGFNTGTSGAFSLGGVSYAGGCKQIDPAGTATYTVTGTLADSFALQWDWYDVPSGSTITFVFQYATP